MHGPKRTFYSFLSICGSGVVCVKCWDRLCILGRASHTKETLPDFCEWRRVTRHPQIFHGLTSCQRNWGVTAWYQSIGIQIPKA